MWVKTGIVTTPGSGTTVINITSKGNNAKGIHLWGATPTADNTTTADAHVWHAFSDGINDRFGYNTKDSNATHDTQRWASQTDLVHIRNAAGDATVMTVTGAAMNANDVTLSYGTFAAGHILHYEIYGGSDCDVEVEDHLASASPFTGLVNGAPDLVLFMTTGQTSWAANSIHAFFAFGVMHDNGGTIEQWGIFSYWGSTGGNTTGSSLSALFTSGQYNTPDFANWTMAVTATSSTGWTWTGTNGDTIAYMSIRTGGLDVQVGNFTKSTSAAPVSQDIATLREVPQFYHLATGGWPSEAINVDQDARVFHGAYDNTDQACIGSTVDDTTETDSHCHSISGEVLFYSTNLNVDGVVASATAAAITDTTPSIEWNPNDAVAITIGYYAIQLEVFHEQDSFRYYNDGTESGATAIDTQNTDINIGKESTFGVRVGGQLIGDPPTESATLQYKDTGDADGEYRDVP